jgi:hypothetical protein
MVKQILEGKIQDDNADWQKCYTGPVMANPGQYTGEDGLEKLTALQGKCCGKSPKSTVCVTYAEGCQAWADGDTEGLDAIPNGEKIIETLCNSWCEEADADWCSSGLSTGAIVGIVVGVIVVIGVVAGVLVFFLVLKKKQAGDE